MTDVNNEYLVLHCGTYEVPSPSCVCSRDHYLTAMAPTTFKAPVRAESPAEPDEGVPLIDAMELDGLPMVSSVVKQELEYQDLYQLQLVPAMYTHADNTEHLYWVMMLDNEIKAYDFDNGQFISRGDNDKVSAINIRLDANKLLTIPLNKRLMFEIYGMRGTYILHRSVAEKLSAIGAKGLHLVPLLDWDMGFGFTV